MEFLMNCFKRSKVRTPYTPLPPRSHIIARQHVLGKQRFCGPSGQPAHNTNFKVFLQIFWNSEAATLNTSKVHGAFCYTYYGHFSIRKKTPINQVPIDRNIFAVPIPNLSCARKHDVPSSVLTKEVFWWQSITVKPKIANMQWQHSLACFRANNDAQD